MVMMVVHQMSQREHHKSFASLRTFGELVKFLPSECGGLPPL
jgi:hypothetical protein